MNNDFFSSVVVVTSNAGGNQNFGTGFIIHQDREQKLTYLLTCNHVVDAVGKENVLSAQSPAKIIANDGELDLAVLLVKNDQSLLEKSALKLCVVGKEQNKFVISGYFRPSTGKETLKRSKALPCRLDGQVKFPVKSGQEQVNGWELIIEGDNTLVPGYSGSPVIDEANNCVVGFVIEANDKGKKGTAISIEALKEVWTEMLPDIISSAPTTVTNTVPPTVSPYDPRYETIIKIFSRGIDSANSGVIPFLGAGVNLCAPLPISLIEIVSSLAEDLTKLNSENLIGVPCSVCPLKVKQWSPEEWSIPTDCPILRQIMAETKDGKPIDPRNCALANEQMLAFAKINLRLLSQYDQLKSGGLDSEELYQKIRELFEKRGANCAVNKDKYNRVHQFLATLPNELSKKGYEKLPYQLILTTNYDDGLELAFQDAKPKQPFDLIYYVAEGPKNRCGKFVHKTYGEICNHLEGEIITGSDYDRPLPWNEHPIILKLYGTWTDKFVITEEHHSNYLSYDSVSNVLPTKLLKVLNNSKNRILLLGYSLNDSDLELILNRFSEPTNKINGNFLIVHQSKPGSLEKYLWSRRKLNMEEECIKTSLEDCINNLEQGIENL